VLSLTSYPLLLASKIVGLVQTSAHAAIIVRLTLATLYASSLISFSYKSHGPSRADAIQRRVFLLISAFQFHALFWAGRTTPNGIVTPVVNTALALIFSRQQHARSRSFCTGLALLVVSMVISRLELVGVVLPVALCGLFSGRAGGTSFRRLGLISITGITAAVFSISERHIPMIHTVALKTDGDPSLLHDSSYYPHRHLFLESTFCSVESSALTFRSNEGTSLARAGGNHVQCGGRKELRLGCEYRTKLSDDGHHYDSFVISPHRQAPGMPTGQRICPNCYLSSRLFAF
jgi:hypothetical protein